MISISIDESQFADDVPVYQCSSEHTGSSSARGDCPDCTWSFYFEFTTISEEGDCFENVWDDTTRGLGVGPYGTDATDIIFYEYDGSWYPVPTLTITTDGDSFSGTYSETYGPYTYEDITYTGYIDISVLGTLYP